MRRSRGFVAIAIAIVCCGVSVRGDDRHDDKKDDKKDERRENRDDKRIEEGFRITPVPVHVTKKNRDFVGLGSYIVNAQAGCNDCHTCPSYSIDPFTTGKRLGVVNAKNFLAGGVAFQTPGGTFVSPNLTPDPTKDNLPDGGHTFAEFKFMMRTGHDADDPHHILQIMPWPIYGNMIDDDLRAVYEYLKAIPHAEPGNFAGGTCPAPGLARPGM